MGQRERVPKNHSLWMLTCDSLDTVEKVAQSIIRQLGRSDFDMGRGKDTPACGCAGGKLYHVKFQVVDADHELDEKLNRPLHDLEFSVRAEGCLASAQLTHVGSLVRQRESALLKVPHLGRKTLREIKEILAELGLELGMDVPWWKVPVSQPAKSSYYRPR